MSKRERGDRGDAFTHSIAWLVLRPCKACWARREMTPKACPTAWQGLCSFMSSYHSEQFIGLGIGGHSAATIYNSACNCHWTTLNSMILLRQGNPVHELRAVANHYMTDTYADGTCTI